MIHKVYGESTTNPPTGKASILIRNDYIFCSALRFVDLRIRRQLCCPKKSIWDKLGVPFTRANKDYSMNFSSS